MKDILTVIVPVYNVKPYLCRCIESILAQDYEPIEIIIIDDGSTDGSSEICDKYRNLENVNVIHQENKGQSSARNVGLEIANGEYIAFLDSDDFIEPNMYSTLIKLLIEYDKSIAACASVSFYENENTVDFLSFDNSIKIIESHELLGDLYCNQNARSEVWNKVFKKEVIGDTRFKTNQRFEEIYFDRIVFQKSNGCVFINKPLHHYLVSRPGNTNSSFDNTKLYAFDELEEIRNDLLTAGYVDDADKILAMQLLFSMILGCQCYEHKGKKEDLEFITKKYKEYSMKNKGNAFARKIKWRRVLYSFSPALLSLALKLKKRQ